MAATQHSDDAKRVQFGVFEADLKSGELRRAGVHIRLQSQPFKLLAALLEKPGEVVSRESLEQRLWGSDTNVDFDHSLGIAVNKLREALGDRAENPRFVETLAKRGYRFIAPVKSIEAFDPLRPAAPSLTAETFHALTSAIVRWRWIAASLLCASLLLGLALFLRPPSRKPFRVEQVTLLRPCPGQRPRCRKLFQLGQRRSAHLLLSLGERQHRPRRRARSQWRNQPLPVAF